MEPELTPEQKEQMKVWAGQRDALNFEIHKLRSERESLVTANQALSNSSSEIQERISALTARLDELDKKEKDYFVIVSSELSDALIEKTRLETERTNLLREVENLRTQKDSLLNEIPVLLNTFKTINDRVGVLDQVVDHVVKVSHQNENEISSIVSKLKSSLDELVDTNQKNVTATNQVLDKLPKMLVELQRTHLIRNKI